MTILQGFILKNQTTMKPLVKPLLLTTCLLFFIIVSAQNKLGIDGSIPGSPTSSTINATTETTDSGSSIIPANEEYGAASSIYFNNWTIGKIVLKDNTVYEDWMLRYNIYNQQMQYIAEGDTLAFANPEEISIITIDQHTFLFDEFVCEKNEKRKGYLELLVDGDCKLYLHRCIAYRYVDECAEPGAEFVREEYFMAKRYLISENGGVAVLLPEKKKELISMLDDEEKDINLFIKTNKIKLCNEDDLKELFSYYNRE